MNRSLFRLAACSLAASLCLIAPASAAPPRYKVVLQESAEYVRDINAKGWVIVDEVGTSPDRLCKRQTCVDIAPLPNSYGVTAFALNDREAVGEFSVHDSPMQHAFLFDGITSIDLGAFPDDDCGGCSLRSFATAINNAGQVAGVGETPDAWHRQAFLWQGGVMLKLGTLGGLDSYANGINRHGHVAGSSSLADGHIHAFVYHHGRMRDLGTLPGFDYSDASAINDLGQIVGASRSPTTDYRGYLYQAGTMVQIPILPTAQLAVPLDINNQGQVVGVSLMADSTLHSWLFDGSTTVDINDLLSTEDRMRYRVEDGRINDKGQIASNLYDKVAHRWVGAVLVPVTKP